jgi:hypothetical protein
MKRKALKTSIAVALGSAALTVTTIFTATASSAAPSAQGAQDQNPAGSNAGSRPTGESAASRTDTRLISLPALIDRYEAPLTNEADVKVRLAQTIADWTAAKQAGGGPRWARVHQFQPPAYYAALDTTALTDECFAGGLFGTVMSLYPPEGGLENLRIFHNGFAELLQRPDMWKGILQLYDKLGAKIDPQAEPRQIVEASLQLDEMRKLYGLLPLKAQAKGKEDQLLAANVRVLQRYKHYLDTFKPREDWPTPGFFREPTSVAQVALLMAKQVDPQGFEKITPALSSFKWSQEQRTEDLKSYMDLVLESLSRISVKGDRK